MSFDHEKYVYWAQDPNYKPSSIVNRREMATLLEVSTQSIDNWILYQGAPCLKRGDQGAAVQIDTAAFMEWYSAFKLGWPVEQWRAYMIKEGLEAREWARVNRLEEENASLRERLAALEGKK
jgi:phage terminase Nu1 subunit (DNA packaging protein)